MHTVSFVCLVGLIAKSNLGQVDKNLLAHLYLRIPVTVTEGSVKDKKQAKFSCGLPRLETGMPDQGCPTELALKMNKALKVWTS